MRFNCDYKSRFRILKGGNISLVVSAMIASATLAVASPSGGVVASGSATISQSGATTTINQSSQKASINWNSFSIGANEVVNFNQPNTNSITLNRVVGNEKSIIDGSINSNGQVWLLNSNGILFNKGSKVNTAGLLATTSNLSDSDFVNGNYNFKNSSTSSVINLGEIDISDSGYATLIAKEVKNSGTIKAIKGNVTLVGASDVSINLNGNSLVSLRVDKGVLDALVDNSGAIYADGGQVYLTTNAVDELLKGVVNHSGIIEASSFADTESKVELFAHGGTTNVSGNIIAIGGFVETSGRYFSLSDGVQIKADKWLIDPLDITIDEALATAIQTALTNGDVTISTAGNNTPDTSENEDSDGSGHIYIQSPISWSANTLTFEYNDYIFVNDVLTLTNTAGVKFNSLGDANFIRMGFNDNGTFKGRVDIPSTGNIQIDNTTYTILSNYNEYQTLIADSTKANGNYVLGTNIDVGSNDLTPIGQVPQQMVDGGASLSSTSNFIWEGNFNGLGHTISNFTIMNADDYAGVFRYNTGTISNIGITSSTVQAVGSLGSGILVGRNDGTIYNSYSSGTVMSLPMGSIYNIGGLIGFNTGNISYTHSNATVAVTNGGTVGGLIGKASGNSKIEYSYANGNVTAHSYSGGLVGFALTSSSETNYIRYCYATGTVTSMNTTDGEIAGGLVGYNTYSKIEYSYATGNVIAIKNYAGGLVGVNANDGYISNSYATGNVNAFGYAGGLVGQNNAISSIIDNTFATGNVSAGEYVGGLVGINLGTISHSFAIGSIPNHTSNDDTVGGFVGENGEEAIIIGNIFDEDTSGISWNDEANTNGSTTTLKTLSTFQDMNWDITTSTDAPIGYPVLGFMYGSEDVWLMGYRSVTYALSGGSFSGTTSIVRGSTITLPTSSFTGGTPLDTDVVRKVYDSNNNDVTANAIAGTLSNGTYTVIVTDAGNGYEIAEIGNTNLTFDVVNPDITYSLTSTNTQVTRGTTITLPTSNFTGGTPQSSDVVKKVYDSNNNDVTASAIAGTLSNGTYTVKITSLGEDFDIADRGNTDFTFSIINPTVAYKLTSDDVYVTRGTTVTLPTTTFSGGTPQTSDVVQKVYDSNNNDVTAKALAGTLENGTYTVKVTSLGENFDLSQKYNTDFTFDIINPTVNYVLSGDTTSIARGTAISMPTYSFTGGTPLDTDVVRKVYDSNNNDVTAKALAGTLENGTYRVFVTDVGENFDLLDGGNTSFSFDVVNPTVNYTLTSDTTSIIRGTAVTMPTSSFTGGTPLDTNVVRKVYDSNNNDVTASAIAGTLVKGTYKVVITDVGENFDLLDSGNTSFTFDVLNPTVNYDLSKSTINETSIYTGEMISIPTPTFTGGTPTDSNVVVKIYDSNNKDVTSSAQDGTLGVGQYTIKVTTIGNDYELATSGNKEATFTIIAKNIAPTAQKVIEAVVNNMIPKVVIEPQTTTVATRNTINLAPTAVVPTATTNIPVSQAITKSLGFEDGTKVTLVSKPSTKQDTSKVISLDDVKEMMNSDTQNVANGVNTDVKVPLAQNSIVQLVNGGVKLPGGVSQQFFVENQE